MEVLAKEAKTQSWKYSCSTKLNACDLKELNDSILATNNKTVFWPQTAFELKKPENDSSLTQQNTEEIVRNHKQTRMVRDGEG